MAEIKVKYGDNGRHTVGTSADGQTVLEIRRSEHVTELHTQTGVWRLQGVAKRTTAVNDPEGRTVAVIHYGHLGSGDVVELPGGEEVRCRSTSLRGPGYKFGDLISAKAPFLFPQRYFTLKASDALMARPDRELLLAIATVLSESDISMAISVAATSQ